MRREEVPEKLPAELNRPFSHQRLTKVILNSFLFPQCMAPWHVCVHRPNRQMENLQKSVLYLLGPASLFSPVYPALHIQRDESRPRCFHEPGQSRRSESSPANAFGSMSTHRDAPEVCAYLWSLQCSALCLPRNVCVWEFA